MKYRIEWTITRSAVVEAPDDVPEVDIEAAADRYPTDGLCDDDEYATVERLHGDCEPDFVLERGRLAEYVPPPPPPEMPPDDAWIDWRGARWATNGHVLVREDVAKPTAYPWKRGVGTSHHNLPTVADIDVMAAALATDPTVVVETPSVDGKSAMLTGPIWVGAEYVPYLADGDRLTGRPLSPVGVWRGDELVAVVMPRREP